MTSEKTYFVSALTPIRAGVDSSVEVRATTRARAITKGAHALNVHRDRILSARVVVDVPDMDEDEGCPGHPIEDHPAHGEGVFGGIGDTFFCDGGCVR